MVISQLYSAMFTGLLVSCHPEQDLEMRSSHVECQVAIWGREGGRDLTVGGLPFSFVYMLYLDAFICVLRIGHTKQRRIFELVSKRLALAVSSSRTASSPRKSPSFNVFRADTFPQPYGYDKVSQPVMACMPSSCEHFLPKDAAVWLMSRTLLSNRSIWKCVLTSFSQLPVYE